MQSCPVEITSSEVVLLAHGEGGSLSRHLLETTIAPRLNLGKSHEDAARCQVAGEAFAITTDSYVVSPLFFPGGDIGSLAVYGTINDLAVAGARAEYLTLSLILEEGLPLATLERILDSIGFAARAVGVAVVSGDTKVVPKGAADQIFINMTGVGRYDALPKLDSTRVRIGDKIIISGPVGKHGIAVMSARLKMAIEPVPMSDSMPLRSATFALHHQLAGGLRWMRDATRGGVAAVLHEWALATNLGFAIDEQQIHATDEVRAICEVLGLDPLHVANEGVFLAIVAPEAASRGLNVLQGVEASRQARMVGEVTARGPSPVVIKGMLGVDRPLDEPLGAPLPRIC